MTTPGSPTASRLVPLLLLGLALILCLAASTTRAAPGLDLPLEGLEGDPVTRFRASLSRDELLWLDHHPEIRFGNGPDFQPFYAWRDGRYTGPSADYLELLSRRTGLRFTARRFDDFTSALAALDHGDIDLIPTLTPTEPRRRKFLFTGGYLHSPAVVVTRSGAGSVALPGNFEGVRVALERGHASRDVLKRSKPAATLIEFNGTEAALRAVSSGEADAYVGMLAAAHYCIEQFALANLQIRQRFDADLSAMAMATSHAQPLLHSILRKALKFVSDDESNALLRRYLPGAATLSGDPFRLTNAELAWLRAHGPVRMGYDQAFYPLSYTNSRHQAEGFSIELFRLLRDKIGMTVEESAGPWSTVLTKAYRGDLDVLVASANTAERRERLEFVGPYLSTPTVIITRSNFQQVWDLSSFAGRKLALLKDHFLVNRIRSAYPTIRLVEVPTQEDALSLVAAGAADVAIGNLHAVNRLIQARFLGTLYIAGHIPDGDSELYLGVRKDIPELAAILRRALESLTPGDIAAAKNRWLDTVYSPAQHQDESPRLAWGPTAAAALVLLGGLYSHRRLRQERRARRTAEARLDAVRDIAPGVGRIGEHAVALQHALAADHTGQAVALVERIRAEQQDVLQRLNGLANKKPPAG